MANHSLPLLAPAPAPGFVGWAPGLYILDVMDDAQPVQVLLLASDWLEAAFTSASVIHNNVTIMNKVALIEYNLRQSQVQLRNTAHTTTHLLDLSSSLCLRALRLRQSYSKTTEWAVFRSCPKSHNPAPFQPVFFVSVCLFCFIFMLIAIHIWTEHIKHWSSCAYYSKIFTPFKESKCMFNFHNFKVYY